MNMADVIVPKSDQINADDLIGRDMTITIRDVQIRGGQEQPVSIFFDGSDKAFRPCKSMSRVLVYCWGADAKQYIGRSLTLYRDPGVKWGGLPVGGIRISHASHIEKAMTMVLAESKASRKPYTVKPLAAPVAGAGAPQQQRQTPEQWAEQHIAALKAATSADDLAAIRQKGAKGIERLQRDHPALYANIIAADPASGPAPADDDPFGLPPVQEGRPEAQHGEAAFDSDGVEIDPTLTALKDSIIAEVRAAATIVAVSNVQNERAADYHRLPGAMQIEVDDELGTRKAALRGGQ